MWTIRIVLLLCFAGNVFYLYDKAPMYVSPLIGVVLGGLWIHTIHAKANADLIKDLERLESRMTSLQVTEIKVGMQVMKNTLSILELKGEGTDQDNGPDSGATEGGDDISGSEDSDNGSSVHGKPV